MFLDVAVTIVFVVVVVVVVVTEVFVVGLVDVGCCWSVCYLLSLFMLLMFLF